MKSVKSRSIKQNKAKIFLNENINQYWLLIIDDFSLLIHLNLLFFSFFFPKSIHQIHQWLLVDYRYRESGESGNWINEKFILFLCLTISIKPKKKCLWCEKQEDNKKLPKNSIPNVKRRKEFNVVFVFHFFFGYRIDWIFVLFFSCFFCLVFI